MDGLPPVSEDKQWCWRLVPPDQQESTETKLADVHSHCITAQGSQITTDSELKMVTERKLRCYQRRCSTGFSPCGTSTVKKRSPSINYWRNAARFTAASNDLTIHWLCICCVILSTYNNIIQTMISEPWLKKFLYLNIGNRLLKEQLK